MISKKNVFRNAARYLGFRGKALDAGAIRLLEDAYGALLTTVEPPLDWQRSLLAVLEARRIGLSLTEGCLMLPEKSVSAVMAVRPVDSRRNAPKSGCAACDLSECAYRREEME